MNPEQVVRDSDAALNRHDLPAAFSYFTDDIVISGAVVPFTKAQFLEQCEDLMRAAPDWHVEILSTETKGDQVIVTARHTGTHTGPLQVRMLKTPVIPPSGIKFSAPDYYTCTVKNDKITAMHFQPPAEGGFPDILRKLGVQLPAGR